MVTSFSKFSRDRFVEVNEEDNKLFLYVVTESQTLVFNLQTLNRVKQEKNNAPQTFLGRFG